jgi:hypothetical protein
MYNTLALAAAALLGSVTLAAAQPAPPPAPPSNAPDAAAASEPMRGMREHMRGEGRSGMMGGMMERHMGGGMGGMMGGGMRGPRGAHFVFEREGATVDLRCAENETTRACVDAAAVLLDKLAPQPAR